MTLKTNTKVIFALTLLHFTGDFYSSFTSPLSPLFVEKLGISLTQVGIVAGVSRLFAFIVQPMAGYLADRHQSKKLIIAGLLLPVIFIPISGISIGFWTLLLATSIGSIGSAVFHPSATGMVPLYAGKNAGFSMSVFNTGGTFAFAVGPLFISWYAVRFGLDAVPYTMIFGLMAACYLYVAIPEPQSEGLKKQGFFATVKDSLGDAWKAVALIWLVMFLRAVVGQSFLTFMPVHYVQKGFSVVSAGVIFSLFTVAGTASGLIAGHISDRIGFKPVFIFTHLVMAPILFFFLKAEGSWVYLGSVLAGAAVLASLPIGVVMAQKLAPRGRSMVASLMMGFAYGLGGFISPLVGKLADIYTIQSVLTGITLIPLLTLPIIFFFPNIKGE